MITGGINERIGVVKAVDLHVQFASVEHLYDCSLRCLLCIETKLAR